MSRIGYSEIIIPNGVNVTLEDGGQFGYKSVKVSGPKGELFEDLRRGIIVNIEGSKITLDRENEAKQTKSYHGLYRSLINNMVEGVTNGFVTELEIIGIGYRAEMQGSKAVFSLGYSHKIELEPPENTIIEVEDQTKIKVSGINKHLVGQTAAKIRDMRPPEPYKGKGVRYKGEEVKRKSAKSVSA